MIEDLAALVILKKGSDRSDEPVVTLLQGSIPEGITPRMLMSAAQDKTTIRKFDKWLAIVLPGVPGEWVAWVFDKVPGVTDLPKIAEKVTELTRIVLGALGNPEQATSSGKVASVVSMTLDRVSGSEKRGAASVNQIIADAIVEAGLGAMAAVGNLDGNKIKAFRFSDQRLAAMSDELAHFCISRSENAALHQDIDAADMSDLSLDAGLLANMAGAERLTIDLPSRSESGLAVLIFGPATSKDTATELSSLRRIAQLSQRKKPAKSLRKRIIRWGAMIAAAALVVWLSLPAQLRVSAAATAEPREAVALALPVGAYLDSVDVRVGDDVAEGDVIATFHAPDLEENRAAYVLELAIEEVSAQSALAENNYAGYQLAQQKMAAARDNLARVDARIASLRLTAPTTGRLVSAVGAEVTGRYLQLGETIAVVQPEASFNVALTVSRVDAPLVAPGQTGEVWFRGVAGRIWTLSTQTPVALEINRQTGTETLIVRGRIMDEDQQKLFSGLAGFAKIDAGEAMRAKVLSRYALEYLRTKAWIWFGLSF